MLAGNRLLCVGVWSLRCAAVVGADVNSAAQSAMAKFYAQGG